MTCDVCGCVNDWHTPGCLHYVKAENDARSHMVAQRSADPVNHPAHYGGDVPHEVVKCLAAWGLESDALLWNAVKYIARAGKKGDAREDLKKSIWYIQRRLEAMQEAMR